MDSSDVDRDMNFWISFSSASVIEIGWFVEEEEGLAEKGGFMMVIARDLVMGVEGREKEVREDNPMAAAIYRYSRRKRKRRILAWL